MMKQGAGFIFFMTLCILSVISILLVTCMHHVLLYHKAINQLEQRHQNFYQLEQLATLIINTAQSNSSCLKSSNTPNQIIIQLLNNRGCLITVGSSRFRYMIEDLGDFPCLMVKQRASHHLRLSMVLLADGEHEASGLQLRLIQSSEKKECFGKIHQINSGISSWRYFSSL
jgi:hypothetical protein